MSVRLMAEVFARYPNGGGEMLLALAIADHAHDDGSSVRPSVAHLAEKTRQSERTVQYQLRKMEASGWLQLVGNPGGGRNTPREYRINPEWVKGADSAPLQKGATDDTKGCNPRHERVQNDALKGATAIAPEPSEPSRTIKEPKGRAKKIALPEWLEPDAWADWHAYRNSRKGWTVRAQELSLRKLSRLHDQGHDPRAVIEQSIECGWTGLFPLKEEKSNGAPQKLSSIERIEANVRRGLQRDADGFLDAKAISHAR